MYDKKVQKEYFEGNKMIRISTKKGDRGETELANGKRQLKSDLIFQVIGDLDELNSWLGLLVSTASLQPKKYRAQLDLLKKMQEALFVISAELVGASKGTQKIRVDASFLTYLEGLSDQMQRQLASGWHQRFLYPGGVPLAAYADLARTVCRRAERSLVALSQKQSIRPVILALCNRFSDYLYLLRCFANQQEKHQEVEFEVKQNN